MNNNIIELENINYDYKNNTALNKLNINIIEGESIAIIGPNGSGKSTLLKMINGIIFPSSGIYRFENQEINSKSLKKKFLKDIS